ncbi:hypothetical protein BC829DRAFT_69670 [Chytridium lagenaria]|nr:hypothetical protein BC829DRAFT_69670 [Chytridium lagenaria]
MRPQPQWSNRSNGSRNMFVKSQLSQDDLARVWDLSSVRRAADLTFPEFAIAMFLIRLKMKGQDIPPALPDNVKKQVLSSIAAIDASKKPAGPPQNFGGPTVGIMAPTSTMPKSDSLSSLSGLAAPRMTDGFAGPLASRAQAVTSPKQLRKDGATWAVTPSEKAQYDSIFKVWDPTNSGFISGDRARQVFSQSGLADNVLAHVWYDGTFTD